MAISDDLAYVRRICADAHSVFDGALYSPHVSAYEYKRDVSHVIAKGFQAALLLCSKHNLPALAHQIEQTLAESKGDLTTTYTDPETAEPYPYWLWKLHSHLDLIENLYLDRSPISGSLALVTQIIRHAEYSMEAVAKYPANETEVHQHIENMLRPIFPDLKHKPVLTKPIKNFQPDTGIPSLKLLIEYKYLAARNDASRVADEILADTAGYTSKHWAYFFFVIYEERRFRTETEWNELLRQCGTANDTWAFVVQGVPHSASV